MAQFDLKSYARRGAALRIDELNQELEAIYGAFPDLRQGSGRGRGRVAGKVVVNHEEQVTGRTTAAPVAAPRTRRRRKPMTAAQRKAVGERMRKYWAARRKASKT
jgi:hypothetical protein